LYEWSSSVSSSWEWEELDLDRRQLAIHLTQVREAVSHSFITNVPLAEMALETGGKMEFGSFLLAMVRHNAACLSVSSEPPAFAGFC